MVDTSDDKETEVLYSINGAADLLKRDRQTLVRALRRVSPDAYNSRGQPRWKLATIIASLALKPEARREAGKYRDLGRYGLSSPTLDGIRREYEKQLALIAAEKSLVKRRDMALKLAPLLARYQTVYVEAGKSLGVVDDDVLGARADLIFAEMLDEIGAAAEWTRDDGFFDEMYRAMWPDADDDEAA
jgi:hypothetical protein